MLAKYRETGASRLIAVDAEGALFVRDRAASVIRKFRQP